MGALELEYIVQIWDKYLVRGLINACESIGYGWLSPTIQEWATKNFSA